MMLPHKTASKPLVSVIMPVFKGKEFAKESIDSILAQTYKNFELIIVEDPSDETLKNFIKKYKDSRIKYYLNEKRNKLIKQLNKALTLSQGEFIARMDVDDISEKNRLEKQIQILTKHPETSIVGTNLTIINETGKVIGNRYYPETSNDIEKAMRYKSAIAHPSVMFRKKTIVEMGGYREGKDIAHAEDYDLWAKMIINGDKFYNIQEKLLRYRLHEKSVKSTHHKIQLRNSIDVKQRHFRFKKKWSINHEIRFQIEKVALLFPKKVIYKLWNIMEIKK